MATEAAEDDDGGVPPLPQPSPSPSTKLLDVDSAIAGASDADGMGRTRRAPNGARARIRYVRARCRGNRQAKKWMASACTAARTVYHPLTPWPTHFRLSRHPQTHRPPDPCSPSFWVAARRAEISPALAAAHIPWDVPNTVAHELHADRREGWQNASAGELQWRNAGGADGRRGRQQRGRCQHLADTSSLRSAFGLVPPSPGRRRPALQQHPLTICFSCCALLEPDARLSQRAPTLPSPCIQGTLC
ncbi:hypothetical protein BJ912DRAFT_997208 [Pholiota molesta]|nr:hypothetical protein BJ912DRAFT_997208 [Pholiota molesta]